MLNLGPHFGARVFGVESGHFTQKLASALIARVGRNDRDLHDLIAALVGARVEHTLFAQTEFLAVHGPLRNFEQGAAAIRGGAIDGGHLDLGAESGFPHRHRNGDLDVVAIAMEEGVVLHFGSDVEIARRRSHGAGVAFAGNAQEAAVARAGRDAEFDGFGSRHAAVAAGGTGVAQFPGSAAPRAGEIEFHGARHLADVAGAFALGTSDFARTGGAGAMAGGADIVTGDVDLRLSAFDGLPEIDVHYVFQVSALFGRGLRLAPGAAAKELREDIAEAAGRGRSRFRALASSARARREVGEVEAAEIHVGMRRLAGAALARGVTVVRVEADLVVHLALLGIAQNVVGFLDVLETIFGGFVAGVQIGVVFARELPVGLTDFIRVGFAGNTESFVVLVLGSRGHKTRAGLARPLQHYFLSSTSTNSASTTLSFPSFLLSSGAPPAPSPDGGAPGWEEADLYMASASLWLAVVSLSVVELIRAGSFSAMAFLTSSRAASISLASASPILARCSFNVFSTL